MLGWEFRGLCLSWHTFCKCVQQRVNCGKAGKATAPAEEPGELVLYFFYPSFFFQTFDLFFVNVDKMKNITGKMTSGLLKAALVHQLEFSRSLGCPKI